MLGTIGVFLIGVVCVAVEYLPRSAAHLLVGAIRLFGRLIDRLPVHLLYRRPKHPAQLSDTSALL